MSLLLTAISLYQFKNYAQESYAFDQRIVGFYGRNGAGKTNLLDAIHYLCFTKSYFTRLDAQNVLQGAQGFRLEGHFLLNNQAEKTVCILREAGRKEFLVNDEAYTRFSKHIGRYPCVVIAPDDVALIIGASEERRRFIDTLLCQLDAEYLQALIAYTKILQQRNSFLRTANDGYSKDFSVLDVLDEQLSREGTIVAGKRTAFLAQLLPLAATLYADISQQEEPVELSYESELSTTLLPDLLRFNRQKDLLIQRTAGGPHRDDLGLRLAGQPFKTIASQGQRKSLLFALKLAEMQLLKQAKGFSPILLLDDVFEKLDEARISNLLARVCADSGTQIFITDTNGERLEAAVRGIGQEVQMVGLRD